MSDKPSEPEQGSVVPNVLPNNVASLAEHGTPKARRLVKQFAGEARRRQAVELRLRGLTYEAIAAQLGFKSKSAAHDAVASALQNVVKEPAEKLRLVEAQRLEELWQALWPAATQGDMTAVAGCLKVMERRAKLLALDAPAKVEGKTEQTVRDDFASLPPHEQKRLLEERIARLVRHGIIKLPQTAAPP